MRVHFAKVRFHATRPIPSQRNAVGIKVDLRSMKLVAVHPLPLVTQDVVGQRDRVSITKSQMGAHLCGQGQHATHRRPIELTTEIEQPGALS